MDFKKIILNVEAKLKKLRIEYVWLTILIVIKLLTAALFVFWEYNPLYYIISIFALPALSKNLCNRTYFKDLATPNNKQISNSRIFAAVTLLFLLDLLLIIIPTSIHLRAVNDQKNNYFGILSFIDMFFLYKVRKYFQLSEWGIEEILNKKQTSGLFANKVIRQIKQCSDTKDSTGLNKILSKQDQVNELKKNIDALVELLEGDFNPTQFKMIIESATYDSPKERGLLIEAIILANQLDKMGIIISSGWSMEVIIRNTLTPISIATLSSSKEMVKMIGESAPKTVNQRVGESPNECPPIFIAIEANKPDKVEVLIKLGAKIEVTNSMRRTPLLFAVANESKECAEQLLKAGANLYTKDINNKNSMDCTTSYHPVCNKS